MSGKTSTVIDVLEEIESTSGTNAKMAVLEANKNVKYLKRFFRTCEDPTIDFGVRKIPTIPSGITSAVSVESCVSGFLDLLENQLAPRLLTGNAAKDEVAVQLSRMDPVTQKWCTRLLLRNLRCGASGKLVERVWPGLVKVYKVLLATPVPVDEDNCPMGVKFPVWCEPKLDGLRCIAEKRNGAVILRTRNGNVLETLPAIKKALETCAQDNFVLDGEAMISRVDQESWNDSASVMMSHKNKKSDTDMTYNVFDSMNINEWDARQSTFGLKSRLVRRDSIVRACSGKSVVAVKGRLIDSIEGLLSFFDECLDNGYEGIMLKDEDGLYEWKRVKTSVMKYKPVQTYEGVIVGWYKGGVGTKHEEMWGGFHVLLENGVTTRVGGGFKDYLRGKINEDPDAYIGVIVECEAAKGLAKNGKMRFPEFLRFRDASDVDPKIFEALAKWAEVNK